MEQKLMRDQMWFHLSMLAMMKGAGRDDEAVAQAEKLQALIFSLPDDLFVQAEVPEDACGYCDGDCPNQPDDSEFLCDGFAGDIDSLYARAELREVKS